MIPSFKLQFSYHDLNINISTNSNKPSYSHSEDEEHDFSDSHLEDHGSEIILKAGTHFNPIDSEQKPNQQLFIITANPIYADNTPLPFANELGATKGVLVAKGELSKEKE